MKTLLETFKQDKLLFPHHLEIVDIKDCYRFDDVYPNGDWGLVDSYARDLNKYKNEVKNNFRGYPLKIVVSGASNHFISGTTQPGWQPWNMFPVAQSDSQIIE